MKKYIYLFMFFLFLIIISVCQTSAITNPLDTVSENLKMSTPDIISFITFLGVLIIAAFDVRVSIMIAFILYIGEFIIFYEATLAGFTGYDPFNSGVAAMTCVVLLALMLLVTYKKTNTIRIA